MNTMSWSRGPNLFEHDEPPASGERFEPLARMGQVLVEKIVSSASPEPDLYDQAQDEWVVLVSGTATLEVGGVTLELTAGDTLIIPGHTPHRVLATSAGALWLAVHAYPA